MAAGAPVRVTPSLPPAATAGTSTATPSSPPTGVTLTAEQEAAYLAAIADAKVPDTAENRKTWLDAQSDTSAKSTAATGTAANTKSATDLLVYNASKVNAKLLDRFTTKPNKLRDNYKDASFIKGAKTAAERKAYAIKLANTSKTGKSAADVAAIDKARLWYTGQTKGGKKAGWTDASLKSIRRGKDDKGKAAAKPVKKPVAGKTVVLTAAQKKAKAERLARANTAAVNRTRGETASPRVTKPTITPPRSRPEREGRLGSGNAASSRYGGALGANPSSSTAGRGADVVKSDKKKPDRFRGRKGRVSKVTDSKVLPGKVKPGTTEFSDAAEAKYKKQIADRKAEAAKRATRGGGRSRVRTASESLGPVVIKAHKDAWNMISGTDAKINAAVNAGVQATVDWITRPTGPRRARGEFPQTTTGSKAAKITRTKEQTGFGYVAPRPKPKKTPAEKRRKQPGAGR